MVITIGYEIESRKLWGTPDPVFERNRHFIDQRP